MNTIKSILLGTTMTALAIPAFAVSIYSNYEPVSRISRDDLVKGYLAGGNCTATVLGGQWVISAAHCKEPTSISTVYQGEVSIKSSQIPPEYALWETNTFANLAPVLDVAIWKTSKNITHKDFMPISTQSIKDNELIKMYGFGTTGEKLNAVTQRTVENWHRGALNPTLAANDNSCQFPEATSDDGWCNIVMPNMMETYHIGRGYNAPGDSGAPLVTEEGYLLGILLSQAVSPIDSANKPYHSDEPLSENALNFLSKDAVLNSPTVMGISANRVSYSLTKNFIINTINGWNYPTWIPNLSGSDTLRIQSLYKEEVNLLNTLSTTGDAHVDIDNAVCYSANNETGVSHGIEQVQPFDVCHLPISSNGREGIITLTNSDIIYVNKAFNDTNSEDTSTDNSNNSGSSGGGSFGLLGLFGLLVFGIRRYKQM